MEINWKIILRIITLLIFILGFLFLREPFIDILNRMGERQNKEYPSILKSSKEFRGKITSRFLSPGFAGTYSFELSNGDKFRLSGVIRNYSYRSNDLFDYLYIGNSIYKPANSDSIYVYCGGKEYYFILDKVINKPKPDYRKYFHKKE